MSLPYFPMYPTDFEADTSHLTLAEDGAYNRLLRLMWMTPSCSLPDDDTWLLRRMRCHGDEECSVVMGIISEFFERKGGRIINARLAKEYQKTDLAHKKRVSAGSKGGKAKALKSNDSTSSKARAMPKQPEPEPEPYKEIDTNVSIVRSPNPVPANDVSEAVSAYNGAAVKTGWLQVQKLTPSRSKQIKARLKDAGGIDGWRIALEKASASDFLTGRTNNPWNGVTFDWLTKPANFTKLMEGNYDNRSHGNTQNGNRSGASTARSGPSDGFAAVAARYANE